MSSSRRRDQKLSFGPLRRSPGGETIYVQDLINILIRSQPNTRFQDMDDDQEYGHQPTRRRRSSAQASQEQSIVGQYEKEQMDLSKALKALNKQVDKADQLYRGFEDNFNNDISGVKAYAGAQLLKELWKKKVEGKESEDGNDNEGGDSRPKFNTQKQHLLRAMHDASSAVLNKHNKASIPDDEAGREKEELAKALRQKISMYHKLIAESVQGVPEKQHECKRLLSDLTFLKKVIDPEDELNRTLFQDDAGEDDGQDWNNQQ